jgi:hypothetical protein
MNVDCVVATREHERQLDVRKSLVYDVDDKVMIIAQTTPPILPSFKGRSIDVTYVIHEESLRRGLSGTISRIVDDYQSSSSEKVGAVYLSDLSEGKQYNLRFAFRVKPSETYKLVLYNGQKETLGIEDISAIGVRFSHDMTREYNVGQQLMMYLGFEQAFYPLKGMVVRKVLGKSENRNKIEFVAVRFHDIEYRVEEELHKIVRNIERERGLNILN